MKLALAAGVALAGLALAAYAHEPPRFDANNDGYVSRAEASALAETAFRDMDRNNDNKLDASDRPEGRGDHFRHHEHREDGERDRSERGGGHREHGGPGPRPFGPVMFMIGNEEADANGDGGLSLEEFRAQQLRFFDAADVNGDGRIRMGPPPESPTPTR